MTDQQPIHENNETEQTTTLAGAIRKSAIGLAIFAFFTAGIITVTQFVTKETIDQNIRAFEARLLLSILPAGSDANQVVSTETTLGSAKLENIELLNVDESESFYRATDASGEVTAVIFPLVAPQGYTEAIRLIVGISANGSVEGVRVTRHKETPGLGDQIEIEKSDWILSFNDKSLTNPGIDEWFVKKDGGTFDQMTGATITPRAIVKAVKQALEFFELNKTELLMPLDLSADVSSGDNS